MNGIPRTTVARSKSLYGLSDLIITFQDGTDKVLRPPGSLQPVFGPQPAERRDAQRIAPLVAVRADLSLRAGKHRSLADGAEDLRGLDGRAAVSRSVPGVADDSGFGGGHHAVPGAVRSGQAGRGRPVGHPGGDRACGEQRQRRGRVLFPGRPVLLRARRGPPDHRRGHRQRRGLASTTACRPWSRMSAAW